MVATVDVQEGNGATPTWTTITAARYCTDDAYNPGESYPCVIPPSGQDYYSYWKHHLLDISGTFTKVNNIRWYCDGTIGWTLGTNGKVIIGRRDSGDHGCPTGSYDQAIGTQGSTGHYMKDGTNGHDYYKGQTTDPDDIENYTSGSPITIDSADHTSAEKSKAAVTQVQIDEDATQGDQADETFTFQYDEI